MHKIHTHQTEILSQRQNRDLQQLYRSNEGTETEIIKKIAWYTLLANNSTVEGEDQA